MIHNPILPGFNPDPSMLKVGDDYYIAVSTFEWFPGVAIYHSRDLANWRLLTHPLTRRSQLDLLGVPSSGGVWAPHLSYDNGLFYLVYTNMRGRKGVYKDLHNYLVTAPDITGPWSEPVYLNSSGFDPSLFHDTDGRKWVANMQWDFRKGKNRFAGIVIQEYDPEQGRLVGPVTNILSGSPHGCTEGPHLFQREGYYYLLFAEGGTGHRHGATLARSKSLLGPYELDPNGSFLTVRDHPKHPLQKAGHCSLVETPNGEWYAAHLCGRELPDSRLCPLGRETALQRVVWTEDGWLRLEQGGVLPDVTVQSPRLAPHPFEPAPAYDDFDSETLSDCYQTLRIPADPSWLSLSERPGYVRLKGRESLYSWHEQSMLARRLQHFRAEAETCVEFEPEHYMQMAGLTAYFDEMDHYYLRISRDEQLGKHLSLIVSDQGRYDEYTEHAVSIEGWNRCYMKVRFDHHDVQFYYSRDGINWHQIGPTLGAELLSDEYQGKLGFTGAFIGICAQDLSGQGRWADFDYFAYRELNS